MSTLFDAKSWDGAIVRLEKTPSGGARAVVWRDGKWSPGPDIGKVMSLPAATPAELAEAGVKA